MNVLTCFAFFIIPESPKYLYSKNEFDKARKSLMFIARFNRVKLDNFIFDEETPEAIEKSKLAESNNNITQNEIKNATHDPNYTKDKSKHTVIKEASFIELPNPK